MIQCETSDIIRNIVTKAFEGMINFGTKHDFLFAQIYLADHIYMGSYFSPPITL